jgi:intracellular sulfur oxidation DsrE/DsrF family protein
MKKYIFFSLLLISALATQAQTQTNDYKVVFDMTNKDSASHKTVIRQASGIAQSSPGAQLEVVIYSGALDMVVQGKSTVAADIEKLVKNKQASFKVCAVTMARNNIDKSQLVPGVEVVPDGIYEIITKQKQGWGYIKAGN